MLHAPLTLGVLLPAAAVWLRLNTAIPELTGRRLLALLCVLQIILLYAAMAAGDRDAALYDPQPGLQALARHREVGQWTLVIAIAAGVTAMLRWKASPSNPWLSALLYLLLLAGAVCMLYGARLGVLLIHDGQLAPPSQVQKPASESQQVPARGSYAIRPPDLDWRPGQPQAALRLKAIAPTTGRE